MGLRDTAINYLNSIFGKEREELDKALSPSIEAEKNLPTNIYSLYGREDIGGLLSVSQNLMDVYADYEAMKDYPDISCFAEGTLVYICDGSMIKAVPIEWLVTNSDYPIVALEKKTGRLNKVAAFQPRLTGRNVKVVKIGLSNGLSLKVTPEHRVLVNDEYVEAKNLKLGDVLTGPSVSFPITGMGFLLDTRTTDIRVTAEAVDAGLANVYDVTTETHNLLANGVICHNSAFRYFANDATQPNIDTGRVIWVTSKHEAIKQSADTLLRKRLRLEDDIWSMAYGLVHMGNEFNELLVTENGVVGLNYLPPVTMRRIERADGALIGFMQDITGRFTEDAKNLKAFMNGQGTLPDHIAVFEDWQVCHMRLNQAQRRSVYGQCQPADSIVWTRNGPTKLIDVKEGDIVLTRSAGQLTTTRVKHKFHNGIKQLYRIKTTHRETRATDNHPFLVDKGNRDYTWEPLIDIRVGDLLVTCASQQNVSSAPPIKDAAFISECVESIEKDVCEDVYDIEVENNEHNFICDGFVVHNSIAHDSRAIWKRLLLLEDSMMLYRLCLRGDSKVWTPNGYKEIKDINEGDEVYSYGVDDKLKKTKVTYKKHNGKDKIFKVKSKHYEIHANATHPVLTEVISRENSGKNYIRTLEYVEVKNLRPGYHKFVTPKRMDDGAVGTTIFENRLDKRVSFLLENSTKLTNEGCYVISTTSKNKTTLLRVLSQQIGYKSTPIHESSGLYEFICEPTHSNSEVIESVSEVGIDDIYDIGVEADEHNFVADGVVVHNTRSPQRMKYSIEVGDMPPDKVEGVLRRAKQELKKKPLVNPKTQKLDMRYNPLCITGDTMIPLLDGKTKSVTEMVDDYNKGIINWVYSIDNTDNNRLVPGKVVWAGATRKNADLVKVTLDNGKSIRCTPDHKFMLRDGSYKAAELLCEGDSLMPFYSRISSKDYGDRSEGYRKVYNPSTKKYENLHSIVAKYSGKFEEGSQVTHHINFNKLDNSPDNLVGMTISDHTALHAALGHSGGKRISELRKVDKELDAKLKLAARQTIIKYNQSPEKRKRTSELNRIRGTKQHIIAYNNSAKHKKDNEIRKYSSSNMWKNDDFRKNAIEKLSIQFPSEFYSIMNSLLIESVPLTRVAEIMNTDSIKHIIDKVNHRKIKNITDSTLLRAIKLKGYKSSKDYKESLVLNHKVASVEVLNYKEDTYCITVDKTHCFATDAGVVIKNSSDEDVIFGMREGRPLATAEIMAGPVWPAIDDVEFFLRKLHATLNVPRSWLGQDGPPPAKSILSSEDIRACRVTMGVQRELRNGLERIIRVDQACRNIDPWKYDFEVNMTIPSGIFELAQMEIRNARADFASRYLGFTSMDYVRKNVFHLSDEVIAEIERQSEKERNKQLETAMKQNKAQMDLQLDAQKQQLAAQQQQVMSNPEMVSGEPNQAGEIPQLPDPLMPLPSDLPKSTLDWKIYDNSKRIEELREGETRRRLGELEDKISKLMDRDAEFSRRIKDHQGFMDDLKNTLPRNMNG